MIFRPAFVLPIALLAAAPLLAQKPTAEEGDPTRARYRDRALAVCVVDLAAAERFTVETRESVCGCAVGRLMTRLQTGSLPALDGPRIPAAMGGDLISCAGQEDPRLASAAARRLAEAAVTSMPAPVIAPVDKPTVPVDTGRKEPPRAERGSSFQGLSWPSWLTDSGLPVWVLLPLGLFVLLFLRGLTRRSEDKDLLGPPPSMRRTQASPPRRP